MGKFKKFITLQTLTSKIILSSVIGMIVFAVVTQMVVASTIRNSELAHVEEKEASDMAYLEDYLGEGYWSVQDNFLYKGDNKIGNGTSSHANIEPFEHLEDETGSFFYSFLHIDYVDEAVLAQTELKKDSEYLRVAGSTKDAQGNSIVGTFMDANVSIKLNETGKYNDYANVEGTTFYCLYQTILDKNENVIGALVVGRSIQEITDTVNKANLRIVGFVALAFVLMISGLTVVIVRWLRNLRKSKQYLKTIGQGTFPDKPLVIKSRDEMKEMADIINEMTNGLKERERIGSELSLAQSIQINMLPKKFENAANRGYFDIFASMIPAREVGGDFYDYFMIDDKNVVFVIGDVSGKGVPAALFMAIAKTVIKNLITSGYTVAECFSRANTIFSENNEAGLFITSWLGMLNVETGVLTFVNAGHNPPLLYKKNTHFDFLKSMPGFVLGGLEGIKYKQSTVQLNEGDRLFLYTDGVTEAHNDNNELFGENRLIKFLNSHKNVSLENLVKELHEEINNFAGKTPQSDDITILSLDFIKFKESVGVTKVYDADKDELYNCMNFINKELDEHGALKRAKSQIDLVVEEIFINIALHGYQSVQGDIEVTVLVENDFAYITFKDRGVPFNPLLRKDPDITASVEERDIGGLGIFLSKEMMDEITYDFSNGQNILVIKKRIKESV